MGNISGFIQKNLRRENVLRLAPVFLILIILPLVVFVSLQRQTINQRAASVDCNNGLTCTACIAGANTCSFGNGSQSCTYQTHLSGQACNPITFNNVFCFKSNCSTGFTCNNQQCVNTNPPTPTNGPTSTPGPTVPQTQTSIVGFGKNSVGGKNQPVYHVTNLSDSGAGSLRNGLSSGNKYIVFDVAGTINLGSQLYIGGSYITVDGFSAPSPGITLTGHTLYMQNNIHDIILQGFRHRAGWQGGQEADAITMARGVYNIVIDHVSVSNFYDEAIDMWDNVHDVTIQNSIMAQGGDSGHNYLSLVGKQSKRITYYRNLFYKAEYRQPAIGHDDTGSSQPSEITGDVVNNVIWDYTNYGTNVYWNGWANVIGNYYYSSTQNGAGKALEVSAGGKAYISGNYSKNGASIAGNQSSPFSVPSYAAISATSACTAANDVKANAGTRPLDSKDQSVINSLSITCN